jgi:hypothetical protein
MKGRFNSTFISTLLITLSLVSFVYGSLRLTSRLWREPYFDCGVFKMQNELPLLGLYGIGFVLVGLIVLGAGYLQNEKWAWFVMLVIWLFFYFPGLILPLILTLRMYGGGFQFQLGPWLTGIRAGDTLTIGAAAGIVNFVVMLLALLLPIRAFFAYRPVVQANDILA